MAASQAQVEVEAGYPVVLVCPLTGNYTFPVWTGPPGLAQPLTSGESVNQFGMTWDDDDRNLRIGASATAYTGEYRCNNGQGEGVLTLTVTCKSLDIDCTVQTITTMLFSH